MGAVEKVFNKHGVLVAVESSYGSASPAVATSTDGFHVHEDPEVDFEYIDDGSIDGKSTGGYTELPNVAPSGAKGVIELKHRIRTTNATLSASVYATVHKLIRAHGYAATFSATPTPNWTYIPSSDAPNFTSLLASIYAGGELEQLKGLLVSEMEISAQGHAVPVWRFKGAGIKAAETSDAAVPTITYPYQAVPLLKAIGVAFQLSLSGTNWLARALEFSVKSTRTIEDRALQTTTAGEHGGVILADTTVDWDLVVEATALQTTPFIAAAAADPYRLWGNGTVLGASLQVGTAQYNRYKFSTSNIQFREKPKKQKGPGGVSRWTLALRCRPSSDSTDVDHTITND